MKMPPLLLSLPDVSASCADAQPGFPGESTCSHRSVRSSDGECALASPVLSDGHRETGRAARSVPRRWTWLLLTGVGFGALALFWLTDLRRASVLVQADVEQWLAVPADRMVKRALGNVTREWSHQPVLKASVPIQWPDDWQGANRPQSVIHAQPVLPDGESTETNVLSHSPVETETKTATRAVPAPRLSDRKPAVLGVPTQESDNQSSVDDVDLPIQREANIGNYIDTIVRPGTARGLQGPVRR